MVEVYIFVLINQVLERKSHPMESLHSNPPTSKDTPYQEGDFLIRHLWYIGMETIHDICVVNTDALSHHKKSPEKCI